MKASLAADAGLRSSAIDGATAPPSTARSVRSDPVAKAIRVPIEGPPGEVGGLLDGKKGSDTCFVLTHGAGTGIEAGGLPDVATALAGLGHVVVRMELPYRASGRQSPPKAEKSVPGFTSALTESFRLSGAKKLIAGGKSYGGRVASMAVAEGADVQGLVFLGYPLHRPGTPSDPRVGHWPDIKVPCLFLQGDRDPFCDLPLLKTNLPLIERATLEVIEGGDHSLRLRRKGADSTTIIVNAIETWRNAEGLT